MKKIPVRNIHSVKESTTGRFNIRRIQNILGGNDLQHDLHRHNFFFILAVQNGQGNHEIDFTPHPVVDKSLLFLRPGQVHQLQLTAGSVGYLMEFDTAFYRPANKAAVQRLRKASNKHFCLLEAGNFEKLNTILSGIFAEFTSKLDGFEEVIKASLEIFFIEYVRQSSGPAGTAAPSGAYMQERFEEFIELMETHIASHKQVSAYTEFMNLSSYQLNEVTKTAVGKTASALIDEYILLEAKRYLLATANQVKEVADLLGYEDVSYFIRFFKKHTGYSPEAFRKNFK